jgi:acyl-CoA synthetase (AMP-forming)/AMP-acid ligase II
MRFMIIVKATPESEKEGALPDPQLMAEMGKFNEELIKAGYEPSEGLKQELRQWVAKEIGALARPDDLRFTQMLPKTRSGKIMRRLLRELATTGDVKGDTTTLEDFGVVAKLREQDE